MLVLVAEKSPYDLDALRSALSAPDLEVLTAKDGAEMMTLAREHSPDVVIVASSLGQMGGFAISRDLKTIAEAGVIPEPKVLVLLERAHDAWLADWSRCDEWRTKPIDPSEVEFLVRSLVEGSPEPTPA